MNECDKIRLRKARKSIVADLQFKEVSDQLIQDFVLNTDDCQLIRSHPTDSDQIRELLSILEKKGKRAYGLFKRAIREKYPWLAEELDSIDVESNLTHDRCRPVVRPPITDLNFRCTLILRKNNEVLKDWKMLGRALDLTEAELTIIEYANQNNVSEQLQGLIDKYRQKYGHNATVDKLVEALRLLGANSAADELEGR